MITEKELKLHSLNSFKVLLEEKRGSSIPTEQPWGKHDVGDLSQCRVR